MATFKLKDVFKNRFIKKEKSDIEKKISELKKIMFKKDEMSIADSVGKLKELAKFNQNLVAEAFRTIGKSRSRFMDKLSALLLRVEHGVYTDVCIREVLDYCFRFGSTDVQRNGVLLLNMYKTSPDLVDRYKLIFLKDKKTNEFLKAKIYAGSEENEEPTKLVAPKKDPLVELLVSPTENPAQNPAEFEEAATDDKE